MLSLGFRHLCGVELHEMFFSPVVSTPESGNIQSLKGNLLILAGPILSLALIIYAFLVSTRIEDDGMNSMEIDDSEEGLSKRFGIWVGLLPLPLDSLWPQDGTKWARFFLSQSIPRIGTMTES